MAIESALYSYLTGKSAITDLVGTRIWPIMAPQEDTYPMITYQLISDVPHHHMTGESGLWMCRIQLNVYDERTTGGTGNVYKSVKSISEALRNVLSGYRGTWGSTAIRRCTVESFGDLPVAVESGEEQAVCAVTADLEVYYTKSAPSGL